MIDMPEQTNWYNVNNIQEIDSPALLVFPERVKHNIQTAIKMAGDVQRLRPHVKTHKSPDVIKLMQEAGIHQFKCATIAEAEMLGMAWAKDVLLAYQPSGPKLQRFVELIRHYPKTIYSCLVDNIPVAKEQIAAFENAGLQVPVYIDINVGMNRTGIAPGTAVIELMKFLSTSSSIKSVGLHVYDGHMRNPVFAEKEKEVNDAYKQVDELLNDINAAGLTSPSIVVGGSPGFSVHADRSNVQCSPGTFVYWDKGYADSCAEQGFLPAAILMTRVVSFPGEGLMTTDLGHKSVAAENEIGRRVFFPTDESLVAVSQSEEHLVLRNEGTKAYTIGDVLYGIPFHICPTVALYEGVITIENGNATGEWITIARDRKISI
jgi:D-serine deaminase-like pyridoxal phosphate-dependent protein